MTLIQRICADLIRDDPFDPSYQWSILRYSYFLNSSFAIASR